VRRRDDAPRSDLPEVDLHRLRAEEAVRRLQRELHTCRVRGAERLVVITGLGFGNRRQEPVLRTKVEAWLRSDEARRLGVRSFERVHRGGALAVRLATGDQSG
jgi:DNA-nicking Smr family endonuclease